MKIVVAIPAFNDDRTLSEAIIGAKTYADELVVIDDGSHDETGLITKYLGAAAITHSKNLGKGAALRDSFRWTRNVEADVLVILDADGQHDPAQIPTPLRAIQDQEADVVIGGPLSRPPDMPWHRWLAKRVPDMATQVKIGERVVDTQSGFKAYSKGAIVKPTVIENGMEADTEILMGARCAGMRIVEVPVKTQYAGLQTSHSSIRGAFDVFLTIPKFKSIKHTLTFYGGFGVGALITSLFFGLITCPHFPQAESAITNLALVTVAAGVLGFVLRIYRHHPLSLITIGVSANGNYQLYGSAS